MEQIQTKIEKLNTSPNDTLSYRVITLINNLTVLLINDPETLKSSASMVVHAGSLKDYPEFQGVAHFLEHMLFMGSEKYPDQAEYQKHIGDNGGWTNAYTSLLITNYHFECSNEAFVKALDIFAQFYIAPLLKEECVDKEVNAVHSEAQMNLKNDFWRRFQLIKSLSLDGSAYKLFSIGNLETLKKEGLMDALRKFHDEFYSANQMALVMYTQQDLDEVEKHVEKIFSPIKDHKIQYQNFSKAKFPFDETNSKKLLKMVPNRESDELILSFMFPSYYKHKKDKVVKYYNHLLGHESEGSILNFLSEEGLATSLTSQFEHTEDYFSDLQITITLTKTGLHEWKKVVAVVGQYIKMLKEEGPKEWIFQEEKDVAHMGFLYPEKPNGARMCIAYAKQLVMAAENGDNLEDFIYDMKNWGEYKEDLIKEVGTHLTLDNAMILLISKEFEDEANLEEYYFKTKYSLEDLTPDVIESFNNPDLSWKESDAEISLPPKNTLIPTDFAQKKCEKSEMKKVRETEDSHVWHQQDNVFNLPKSRVACQIYTDVDDIYTNVKTCMMKDIWVELFDDSKRSMDYLSEMAKCNFSVSSLYKSNKISGGCYSQSLGPYLEMLLDEMEKFKKFNDQKKFENVKEKYINDYLNKERNAPFRKMFGMVTQILTKGKFTYGQIIEALRTITFDEFMEFKAKMYQRCRFEWLFEGNITEEESLQIAENFEKKFKALFSHAEILPKDGLNNLKSIKIPDNKTYFLELENKIPDDNNGVFMKLYQVGQGFEEFNAKSNFLGTWLKAEYFEELRTNQQLGYAVFAIERKYNGVYYIMCMIQSNVKETNHLRLQTEKFLKEWLKKIEEMTEEKFNEIKKGCIASALEKDKNLLEKFSNDWYEICDHDYIFDRKQVKAKALEELKKEEVVELYKRVFLENVQALEVHQYTPEKKEEGVKFRQERVESGEVVFIETVDELKNALGEFEDLTAVIP